MKIKIAILISLFSIILISGCSKEPAGKKFAGTYTVTDAWKSTTVGSGNLAYDMMVVADGDDGIMLMNVNKTFSGVKAKVSSDEITVGSQMISSNAGTKYQINGYTGKLKDDKLDLKFVYSDVLFANAVGEVECTITGTKQKTSSDK